MRSTTSSRGAGPSCGPPWPVTWAVPVAAREEEVVAEAAARGIGVTPVGPTWHGLGTRFDGLLVGYGRPPGHDVRRCYSAFAALMADMTA